MASDIQAALDAIGQYRKPRQTLSDYYDGIHTLTYATEKFKNAFGQTIQSMRDNLCATVVDAGVDRMEVIGFSGDDSQKELADKAWKLWQNSQMELTSINTHTEAVKTGVAFVIVWPDDKGKAKFYLQNSLNCAVIVDAENGLPLFGAKLWELSNGNLRLNILYADRTDKFVTQKKPEGGGTGLKDTAFVPTADNPTETNPFGVVPMFEFSVDPILSNVIPLQDALNKTLCDKLVAMEFAGYPQRYATGLQLPTDEVTGKNAIPFQAAIDRLWTSTAADTKFGEFTVANLEQFLKVADSYRIEMARVSGTPLHYFAIQSDAMSGEALKTLESRFTKRITRTTLGFGPVWSEAMKLALRIENNQVADNLTAQWASPEQRSEKEFLETLGLKRDVLEIPVDTLRFEAGYSDEQVAEFNKENELITVDETLPIDDAGTN